MPAVLLHFFQEGGKWQILEPHREALRVSASQVSQNPVSILERDLPQNFLGFLRSILKEQNGPESDDAKWVVHEIGRLYKLRLSSGEVNAVNVIVVKETISKPAT
ncbi:MAG: hypothetical protein Q9201_001141 [Fulgogasparrea decipioides]